MGKSIDKMNILKNKLEKMFRLYDETNKNNNSNESQSNQIVEN